jgi:superfamily II DNA or RNA helicase
MRAQQRAFELMRAEMVPLRYAPPQSPRHLGLLTGQTEETLFSSERNPPQTFHIALPHSWLGALVGAWEKRLSNTTYLTLISETGDFHYLVRPSRNTKSAVVSNAIKSELKDLFMADLKSPSGVPLARIPGLPFRSLRWEGGDHPFMVDEVDWEQARRLEFKAPSNLEARAEAMFRAASVGALREANRVLRGATDGKLQLPRLGIHGGGTEEAIGPGVAPAFRLLDSLQRLVSDEIQEFPWRLCASLNEFKVQRPKLTRWIHQHLQQHLGAREQNPSFGQGQKRHQDEKTKEEVADFKWYKEGDSKQRVLWQHQQDALRSANHPDAKQTPKTHLFLNLAAGSGKTLIALLIAQRLCAQGQGHAPRYIILATPASAMASVAAEVQCFTKRLVLLGKKQYVKGLAKTLKPKLGYVMLVEHDFLRQTQELEHVAHESLVIIDEVHKLLAGTQRTAAGLRLGGAAKQLLIMSGTPVIDDKIYKIMAWLRLVCDFPVTVQSFLNGMASSIAYRFDTGIVVREHQIKVPLLERDRQLQYPTEKMDLRMLLKAAYRAVTPRLVQETRRLLRETKSGVFLIANDEAHQQQLRKLLLQAPTSSADVRIHHEDVRLISRSEPLCLDDASVKAGKVHDFKVVITRQALAEGYTLTRLGSTVTSIYFSNQATRTQLRARVNRLGQARKELQEVIVLAGVLEFVAHRYNSIRSLEAAVNALAILIRQNQS